MTATISLASVNKDVQKLTEQVNEHETFINGNGVTGAKTRLALIESGQARIQTMLWAVISLLISFIGAGAGVTIWFITTVLPQLYGHIMPK